MIHWVGHGRDAVFPLLVTGVTAGLLVMPPFNKVVCLVFILSHCLQPMSPWIKHLQTNLCLWLEARLSQGSWEDRWVMGWREEKKKREERTVKRDANSKKEGKRYPSTEKSRMRQKDV